MADRVNPPSPEDARLEVRPITLAAARRYVAEVHRHNDPPTGWLFGVSIWTGDKMRGVGIAGRPRAIPYQDGQTMEFIRVCTDGVRNGCSMLYGALWRAARALGYRRGYTYTRADEPGSSLLAVGFVRDAELPERDSGGWANRPGRYETDLFGTPQRGGDSARVRWKVVA